MNSQLTAYIALVCTSGVFNLFLCLYVLSKRHLYTNIANYFILYTAAITIYCFGSAFGLTGTSLDQLKAWTIVQYVGMPFAPPLGLLFIGKYLGVPIGRRLRSILLAIPCVTLAMVATNDWHHLYYKVFEIEPELGAPYIHLEIGLWYAVHGIVIFGCMFGAFLLLLSRWNETDKVYRPQMIALMCGQLVPIVTAFVYLLGLTPPGIDPVPMVLWISSILYLVSINSSRMFTLVPVAKEAILNSIDDGVLVLDETGRIVEYNQGAKSMFPQLDKSMFGMDLDQVWTALSGEPFPSHSESASFTWEFPSGLGSSKRIYQVRTSSIQHKNNRQGMLILLTDMTEIKGLQAQLERQAYYDDLTRIYNRRAFFQICEEQYADAKQASSPFSVLLIDIDYFKKVNDTYGHHTGDMLLKHVVDTCRKQLAEEGMLFARYGGEEFALALAGRTAEEGEALANRLRSRLEASPLRTAEGTISVTLSCGVAEAGHASEETLHQLLHKADKALYEAKDGGRNQVRVYAGE